MNNTELQYVYKYVNASGDAVYVGITNNLQNRIQQHKADKLQEIKDPTIYYFPVKHRADAELLETYLINYYRTGYKYNVSKTKKGDVSFMDICTELPWVKYEGQVDQTLMPFLMSSIVKTKEVEKEVPVIKTVYVKRDSLDAQINQIWKEQTEIYEIIEKEIQFETNVIEQLTALLNERQGASYIAKGLELHQIRLEILKQKGIFDIDPFNMDKYKYKNWIKKLESATDDILEYENRKTVD